MSDDLFTDTCIACDTANPEHALEFERDKSTTVNIYLKATVCTDCITQTDTIINEVKAFAANHDRELTDSEILTEINNQNNDM